MNVKPPLPADMWQQVPPPVQSALLEAWQQSEQRCHSLEAQLRQLRDHLDRKDKTPSFPAPALTPSDQQGLTPPAHEAKRSRGRRRQRHRTAREKRERRRGKIAEWMNRYLFWPLVVAAVVMLLWGVLQAIGPGGAPSAGSR